MAEVGSYYISIMPSLKGFTKDVDKSLGDAGVSGGKSFISKFADAIGSGAAMVAKALAGATVATGTAFAAISKASLDAYADYEQLTGGVEKLFGSSSDTLMRYANDAYRTMGISANSYMEQSTSFAEALVSDLGGDTGKAVESVQVAMTSMADNASIFGTAIGDVQNAYQGFAKQNYTIELMSAA